MKICLEDGCWAPTPGTRCMRHEREFQAARNRLAGRKPRRTRSYMNTTFEVGAACWCCGSTEDLTKHHVDPLARRLPKDLSAVLIPMCRSCNSSIGSKTMAGLACPLHGGEEA